MHAFLASRPAMLESPGGGLRPSNSVPDRIVRIKNLVNKNLVNPVNPV